MSAISYGDNGPQVQLRTAQARTREALDKAIGAAMKWINAEGAQNWFAHCDYHVQ